MTSFIIWVRCRNATGAKTLLTEISMLRYAVSYDKVERYKQPFLMDEDLPITDAEKAGRKKIKV